MQISNKVATSRPPTTAAIPMPALAPELRPVFVFGVQVSPVGQMVEEAGGLLVTADELVREVEVEVEEVEEVDVEAEEV